MPKYFILGLIVGLALLISSGIGMARKQQRNKPAEDFQESEYRAELGDATPVQLGVLSDRQRIHSALYKHYAQIRGGKISALVSQFGAQFGDKGKIIDTGVAVGLGPLLAPDTPEHYFQELLRRSDTAIRGKVISKTSQITEDEWFVFTDYDVFVTEVFKNTADAPIDYGRTITVTRPGGKVLLSKVIVRAVDQLFAPLPLNGHEVVLFLKFIPESKSYTATAGEASFELNGSSLRPLTGGDLPTGVLQDAGSFLETIRSAPTFKR
jgi:hypothetical protein